MPDPESLAPEHVESIDETHVSRNANIGLLADLHYTPDVKDDLLPHLRNAVDHFNDAGVNRVVVMGDLIMEGEDELADEERFETVLSILEDVGAPLTVVPGNHDVVNTSSEKLSSIVDAPLYGTFEITPSITGIYLDSSTPEYPDARGYLPDEQLDFLAESLAEAENAVVFVHHPVHYHDLPDQSWFSEHPECAFLQNKFQVNEILAENDNVLAVLNGHSHQHDHTEYETGTAFGNDDNPVVDHFTVNAINEEKPGATEPNGKHAILNVSESRLNYELFNPAMDDPEFRVAEHELMSFTAEDAVVALGGTFDPVHDGHRELFKRGFELGDLLVGMTSDKLAPKTRHEERFILPFEERKASLGAELARVRNKTDVPGPRRSFFVEKLDSPDGIITDDPDITHLLVSPETLGRAVSVNETRVENGHDPLTIEVVEPATAADGKPLSSTRICKGEIDTHGNRTPQAKGREPLN